MAMIEQLMNEIEDKMSDNEMLLKLIDKIDVDNTPNEVLDKMRFKINDIQREKKANEYLVEIRTSVKIGSKVTKKEMVKDATYLRLYFTIHGILIYIFKVESIEGNRINIKYDNITYKERLQSMMCPRIAEDVIFINRDDFPDKFFLVEE